MANPFIKRILFSGALCAGAALMLTSCLDDSYDLNKVDLTMGLGSDGLAVTLGNTENIMLNDILDTDESVKLDANNLYYLVENGSTNINMKVDGFSTNIADTKLNMNAPVLSFADVKRSVEEKLGTSLGNVTSVAVDNGLRSTGKADGSEALDFEVSGMQSDVTYLKDLVIEDTDVKMMLHTANTPANMPLGVISMNDVEITLPSVLRVKEGSLAAGWTLDKSKNTLKCASINYNNAQPTICALKVDKVVLNREPKNGKIEFTENELTITMKAQKVTFGATEAFTMHENDVASVRLDIVVGNSNVSKSNLTVVEATGKFNPVIDPQVNPIDIGSSLPDFLKDEEVALDVANPTLRFTSDFSNIPVGVNFSGKLTSVFEDASKNCSVTLPEKSFENNKYNVLYYAQTENPYDPSGLPAEGTYDKAQVSNLNTLVKKIPEQIKVDLSGNKVKVKDQLYTIKLNQEYTADADYSVFVPFEFNKGLSIVYNDSTNSFNDDIDKYAAEGIRITALAKNAIPLDLNVAIEATDVNGNVIEGIVFTPAVVKAGSGKKNPATAKYELVETPITLDATLKDPNLLKLVDKLIFKVRADNKETTESHTLVSDQYLRLDKIKLRLKGAVTADFN